METMDRDRIENEENPITPRLEEAQEALGDLNRRFLAFARERPGTCIVGALALGFVIGKIAARM